MIANPWISIFRCVGRTEDYNEYTEYYPQTPCVAQTLTLGCRVVKYDERLQTILHIRNVFWFRIQSFQGLGFRV